MGCDLIEIPAGGVEGNRETDDAEHFEIADAVSNADAFLRLDLILVQNFSDPLGLPVVIDLDLHLAC